MQHKSRCLVGILIVVSGCGAQSEDRLSAKAQDDQSEAEPVTVDGAENPSSDELPSEADPENPDAPSYLRWDEFVANSRSTLPPAPLDIRSAAYHPGMRGDELLLTVAMGDSSRRVVVVDVDSVSYRIVGGDVECGDCAVGSTLQSALIATTTGLWESTDGAYRFNEIAQWDPPDNGSVRRVMTDGSALFVNLEPGWLATTRQELSFQEKDWPGNITSVTADSAVEYNARYATLHTDIPQTAVNLCSFPNSGFSYGLTWHSGTNVLLACRDNVVAFTPDLGNEEYTLHSLDAPALWLGQALDLEAEVLHLTTGAERPPRRALIATAFSWYFFDPASPTPRRVGKQPTVPTDEVVSTHLVDANGRRGLRISDLGISISPLDVTSH